MDDRDRVHDRQLSEIITCLLTYLYKLVVKKNKIFSDEITEIYEDKHVT